MEMWIWQLYQNEINFFEREAAEDKPRSYVCTAKSHATLL